MTCIPRFFIAGKRGRRLTVRSEVVPPFESRRNPCRRDLCAPEPPRKSPNPIFTGGKSFSDTAPATPASFRGRLNRLGGGPQRYYPTKPSLNLHRLRLPGSMMVYPVPRTSLKTWRELGLLEAVRNQRQSKSLSCRFNKDRPRGPVEDYSDPGLEDDTRLPTAAPASWSYPVLKLTPHLLNHGPAATEDDPDDFANIRVHHTHSVMIEDK